MNSPPILAWFFAVLLACQMSADETVHAADAPSNSPKEPPRLWTWEFPSPRSLGEPRRCIADARVVDAAAGNWSVVVLVGETQVGDLSKQGGSLQWISDQGRTGQQVQFDAAPKAFVAGNTRAPWLILSRDRLICMADDGTLRWRSDQAGIAQAVQAGECILLVSGDDLVALSTHDGHQVWRRAGLGTPAPGTRPYFTHATSDPQDRNHKLVTHLRIEQANPAYAHLVQPSGRMIIDVRDGTSIRSDIYDNPQQAMSVWLLEGDVLLATEPKTWSVTAHHLPDGELRWRHRPPAAPADRSQVDSFPASVLGTWGEGDSKEVVVADVLGGLQSLQPKTGVWTRLFTGRSGRKMNILGATLWQDVVVSRHNHIAVIWTAGKRTWRIPCDGVAYGTSMAVAFNLTQVWAIHRPAPVDQ